jgi:hypothetical protein
MIGVKEISIEWVIENGLRLFKRDAVLFKISFSLFLISLKFHRLQYNIERFRDCEIRRRWMPKARI